MKLNPAKIDLTTLSASALRQKKYEAILPELYELTTVIENSPWHDQQSVFDHIIGVFEGLIEVLQFADLRTAQKEFFVQYLTQKIGQKNRKEILIAATLLHDIAKKDTLVKNSDGMVRCPLHELLAAARIKNFAARFDLNAQDSAYLERIVRFHGFVSEILNLMISTGDKEKYLKLFEEVAGDVAIELILLMQADLRGCDLDQGDPSGYKARVELLTWMLKKQ